MNEQKGIFKNLYNFSKSKISPKIMAGIVDIIKSFMVFEWKKSSSFFAEKNEAL